MTDATYFSLSIILPNLFLMAFGFFLKKTEQISNEFVNQASFLIFNYSLPTLLFFSLLNSQVEIVNQYLLLSAGAIVTLILYLGAEVYAYLFILKSSDKGVFVQGIFRSNLAIIALATVQNAYGDIGLNIGAIYIGIITILFNILAVITLSRSDNMDDNLLTWKIKITAISKKIIKNPLIIALVSGFTYKLLNIPMPPKLVQYVGDLLASITLPLALICAGATLNLKSMLKPTGLSMKASIGRIIIAPIVAITTGIVFGLDKEPIQMGVLFLMVSAPMATSGFIMAKAMGANEELAANILAFTTVFSLITMGLGTTVLRSLGWM